jgi:hypothetical protein
MEEEMLFEVLERHCDADIWRGILDYIFIPYSYSLKNFAEGKTLGFLPLW